MKHQEFYTKYKTKQTPRRHSKFSKRNLWQIFLIIAVAVLAAPLAIYKYVRSIPFSLTYYLQLVKYSIFIAAPFGLFIFWVNWKELQKKSRGYVWMGKFKVIQKHTSFLFCYLQLSPGMNNRLKVTRSLFDKIHVGDFIMIRRDALGFTEQVRKVSNLSARLAKIKGQGNN